MPLDGSLLGNLRYVRWAMDHLGEVRILVSHYEDFVDRFAK